VRSSSTRVAAIMAIALLAVVHVGTRLAGLGRSLWWDEAFTAHRYVRGGPSTLLDADLYYANNHVLFSALTWLTTRFAGTSEPALRLWAVVPALAGVTLVVWWLWRRLSPAAALAALALFTASTLHATMSIEARGYGLVLLTSSVLLVVGSTADRTPSLRDDIVTSVAGLVAMLTFPPTVAVYLAHAGVSLVRRQADRGRLIAMTAAVGAVTALVYLPLLPAMVARADRVGSRFADPVRWWSPVIDPLRLTATPSLQPALGGVRPLAVLTAVVLGLIGISVVLAGRHRALGWHLLAALGGSMVALGAIGFHLADRYLTFLLPHAVVATAMGLVAVVGDLRDRPPAASRWAAVAVPVVVALVAVPSVWRSMTTPVQAFADAAAAIEEEAPRATVVVDRLHVGWAWYLHGTDVDTVSDQEALDTLICGVEGPTVFAPDPDMGKLAPPDCLTTDAERRFPQQRDPGDLIVYIAP
jgi:hypothetical protein